MSVLLSVVLWAQPGEAAALVDYEDRVLTLLADHGARVVHRVRAVAGTGAGAERGVDADEPTEVHLLEFPSEDAFAAYMADKRRLALAPQRERAIARTLVVRVEPVTIASPG